MSFSISNAVYYILRGIVQSHEIKSLSTNKQADSMAKDVFLVKSENKTKAEEAVKRDDIVSRAGITIKAASTLDVKEDGYFLIIDGRPDVLKRAGELLKGLAERYKDKEAVLKKIEDEENRAIEGFGNIL